MEKLSQFHLYKRKRGKNVVKFSSLGENITADIKSTGKKNNFARSQVKNQDMWRKDTIQKPAHRNDIYRILSVNRKQYETYRSSSEASILIKGALLGRETDGLSRLQELNHNSQAKSHEGQDEFTTWTWWISKFWYTVSGTLLTALKRLNVCCKNVFLKVRTSDFFYVRIAKFTCISAAIMKYFTEGLCSALSSNNWIKGSDVDQKQKTKINTTGHATIGK